MFLFRNTLRFLLRSPGSTSLLVAGLKDSKPASEPPIPFTPLDWNYVDKSEPVMETFGCGCQRYSTFICATCTTRPLGQAEENEIEDALGYVDAMSEPMQPLPVEECSEESSLILLKPDVSIKLKRKLEEMLRNRTFVGENLSELVAHDPESTAPKRSRITESRTANKPLYEFLLEDLQERSPTTAEQIGHTWNSLLHQSSPSYCERLSSQREPKLEFRTSIVSPFDPENSAFIPASVLDPTGGEKEAGRKSLGPSLVQTLKSGGELLQATTASFQRCHEDYRRELKKSSAHQLKPEGHKDLLISDGTLRHALDAMTALALAGYQSGFVPEAERLTLGIVAARSAAEEERQLTRTVEEHVQHKLSLTRSSTMVSEIPDVPLFDEDEDEDETDPTMIAI